MEPSPKHKIWTQLEKAQFDTVVRQMRPTDALDWTINFNIIFMG